MKLKPLLVILIFISLSSCTITKMRYSRGFNIGFAERHHRTDDEMSKTKLRSGRIEKLAIKDSIHPPLSIKRTMETHSPISEHFVSTSQHRESPINPKEISNSTWHQHRTVSQSVEGSAIKNKSKLSIPLRKKDRDPITSDRPTQQKSGIFAILALISLIITLVFSWAILLAFIFSIIGMERTRKYRTLAVVVFALTVLLLLIGILVFIAILAIII